MTERPALAILRAAVRPLRPAPTTITSALWGLDLFLACALGGRVAAPAAAAPPPISVRRLMRLSVLAMTRHYLLMRRVLAVLAVFVAVLAIAASASARSARSCAGFYAHRSHPAILSLDPRPRAPRVFAMQYKQTAGNVVSYASFREKI